MISNEDANATLEFFEVALMQNANVRSISVVRLSTRGTETGWGIEIGVIDFTAFSTMHSLPVIHTDGSLSGKTLPFSAVQVNEIKTQ